MPTPLKLTDEPSFMPVFKSGDRQAFRIVYDQMVAQLTFYAENITHQQDVAEDIVANSFHKLFHHRKKMKSIEHIKRWLYTIVKHECIDHLRDKQKKKGLMKDQSYLTPDGEVEFEFERIKSTMLNDLYREIKALPKQRRTIIEMYFFEERETREIASILDLSPQTVLNHKTKAIDALKKFGFKERWLKEGILICFSLIVCSTVLHLTGGDQFPGI